MNKVLKKNIPFILFTLIIFFIDRLVKNLVVAKLSVGESFSLIDGFFSITYIKNFGAAFGILQGKTIFLSIVTIFVSILILFLIFKSESTLQKIAFTLIFAGAIGNIYDRLKFGYVIDMFDFYGIWKFIFNFADISVVIGTFLLCIILFMEETENDKSN